MLCNSYYCYNYSSKAHYTLKVSSPKIVNVATRSMTRKAASRRKTKHKQQVVEADPQSYIDECNRLACIDISYSPSLSVGSSEVVSSGADLQVGSDENGVGFVDS